MSLIEDVIRDWETWALPLIPLQSVEGKDVTISACDNAAYETNEVARYANVTSERQMWMPQSYRNCLVLYRINQLDTYKRSHTDKVSYRRTAVHLLRACLYRDATTSPPRAAAPATNPIPTQTAQCQYAAKTWRS